MSDLPDAAVDELIRTEGDATCAHHFVLAVECADCGEPIEPVEVERS